MAASLIIVLVLCPLLSVSAELQPLQITARPGDDVTLLCKAPNYVAIAAVEWSRPDLKKPVYLKSDGHVMTADQDPSYKNRTQLKDDEMKNGDLSLVLKKVNYNDGGTYECHYRDETGGRRKRSLIKGKPISIVQMDVTGPRDGDQEGGGQRGGDAGDGEDKQGHLGVIIPATLIVAAAGLAVAGVVIYKKRRGRLENNPDVPGDDPDVHQQLQVNENSQKSITHNISDIQV